VASIAYESLEVARRRRIRHFLLVLFLLLIAAKVAILRVGDRAWTGAIARFWEHRCLTYTLPDDRVAFVAAPRGIMLPSYLGDFSNESLQTWGGTVAAAPYPIELAELQKHRTRRPDIAWESLPAPVFLHGLRNSQGREWLVTAYVLANNPNGWWTVVATARRPMDDGVGAGDHYTTVVCWPLAVSSGLTLVAFAGQPVASDPSKFTIKVRLNGTDQIITGTLRDDASIDFTSSTGFKPWGTDRAGPLQLPPLPQDNALLPID